MSATTAATPERTTFSSTRPVLREPMAAEGGDTRTAVPTFIKEEYMTVAEPMEPERSLAAKQKPILTFVIVIDFQTQP